MKEKIVYIKNNGKIEKGVRIFKGTGKSYLTEEDNCFTKEINLQAIKEYQKKHKKDVLALKQQISTLLTNTFNISTSTIKRSSKITQENMAYAENIMKKLKNATSRDEIIDIVMQISDKFFQLKNANLKKGEKIMPVNSFLVEFIEKEPDTVAGVAVKEITNTYYKNKLNVLGKEKVDELERAKVTGYSAADILKAVDDDFSPISKKNGMYNLCQTSLYDTVSITYDLNKTHKCWGCANAYSSICPKIEAIVKLPLEYYDFITQGTQIGEYGIIGQKPFESSLQNDWSEGHYKKGTKIFVLDSFVVEVCKNYVPIIENKKQSQNMPKKKMRTK